MKTTIKEDGGQVTVALKGNLTEECEDALLELRDRLRSVHVVFECAEIKYINSYGTGRWLNFVRDLGAHSTYEFRNCTINFLDYAIMLPSFIGKGVVTSLLIPYTCPDCGNFTAELVEGSSVLASQSLPEVICRKCETSAESEVNISSLLRAIKPNHQ